MKYGRHRGNVFDDNRNDEAIAAMAGRLNKGSGVERRTCAKIHSVDGADRRSQPVRFALDMPPQIPL